MEQRVDRCDMLNEPLKRCTSRRGRGQARWWRSNPNILTPARRRKAARMSSPR